MSNQNDALQSTMAPSDFAYNVMIQARALRSAYMASLVRSATQATVRWFNHRRTLAAVEDLSPRMLADIGLDALALKAGVVRRVEDERTASFTMPTGRNLRRPQHAADSHVNDGVMQTAANTDVRGRNAA